MKGGDGMPALRESSHPCSQEQGPGVRGHLGQGRRGHPGLECCSIGQPHERVGHPDSECTPKPNTSACNIKACSHRAATLSMPMNIGALAVCQALPGGLQRSRGTAHAITHRMVPRSPFQVRRSTEKISLPMMLDIIENQEWGPSAARIPPSEAKNRLALVTAAKAVAWIPSSMSLCGAGARARWGRFQWFWLESLCWFVGADISFAMPPAPNFAC